VAVTAPVPRPPHRFWRWCARWMTISRHPEPGTDPHSHQSESGLRDSSFRLPKPPAVLPTDSPEELGPCSLDPGRSFWSAFAELIRDRTSPADFCNIQRRASNQTRALDPRRDGGLDLLPFLTCHAASLAGAMVTRRAALRPLMMTPVLVLSHLRGFAQPRCHHQRPTIELTPDAE